MPEQTPTIESLTGQIWTNRNGLNPVILCTVDLTDGLNIVPIQLDSGQQLQNADFAEGTVEELVKLGYSRARNDFSWIIAQKKKLKIKK